MKYQHLYVPGTYKFDTFIGDETCRDKPAGFIQAELNFCGIVFDVTYDIESDWSAYKIDVAGYTPETQNLRDGMGKTLNQAVVEAQDNLYRWMEEKCEDWRLSA